MTQNICWCFSEIICSVFVVMFVCLSIGVVLYSQCDQYVLIQEVKTWHEADVFCREHQYLLATVHSKTDLEDFKAELSASNFISNVWMGLYVDVNSWRWSFQNENLTFTKWSTREPNNYGGHEACCQYRKGGSWNDASCLAPMLCVCFDGEKWHNTFYFDIHLNT